MNHKVEFEFHLKEKKNLTSVIERKEKTVFFALFQFLCLISE